MLKWCCYIRKVLINGSRWSTFRSTSSNSLNNVHQSSKKRSICFYSLTSCNTQPVSLTVCLETNVLLKRPHLYLLHDSTKYCAHNRFRCLSSSLRPSSQQIPYISYILSVKYWKYSLNRSRKKSFNTFLVLLSLPLRGCKFWTLPISSEKKICRKRTRT